VLDSIAALLSALRRMAAVIPETVVDPPDAESGYPGGDITHCPACSWVEGETEHGADYCYAISARAALEGWNKRGPLRDQDDFVAMAEAVIGHVRNSHRGSNVDIALAVCQVVDVALLGPRSTETATPAPKVHGGMRP
jgi:hypothetical protein